MTDIFGRDDCMKPAGMKELKIVIPACLLLRHPRMRHLRHPRMLLSGDILNRLFQRSQTVWEIPDRYFVSSGMTGGRRSRLGGRDDEKFGLDD